MYKNEDENKRISPFLTGISVFIACLFIMIVLIMLTYFNAGNLGVKAINLLRMNETTAIKEQQENTKKSEELSKLSTELKKRDKELKEKEQELLTKEEMLNDSLEETEKLKKSLSGCFESIESIAQLYSSMEPQKVAELLEKQEDSQLKIKVIKALDTTFASSVLSCMDPNMAADLLEKIVSEEVAG